MRKVGVIGTGDVGTALSDGFVKHGWSVMRGSRDPKKLADWKKKAGANGSVGTFAQTATFGEVVVLAVKGSAAEAALKLAGVENLAGKVVIDPMNPIADAPVENGLFRMSTGPNESLMERVQSLASKARVVKAWSCVGSALMVDPQVKGGPPTMFVCGNDAAAKADVGRILVDFGWEWEDMGAVTAARAIEPLAGLWCIPGFLRNDWVHAFKMLRP